MVRSTCNLNNPSDLPWRATGHRYYASEARHCDWR